MSRRQRATGRRESGTFSAMPHALLDAPAYRALSGSAVRVHEHMLRQYNGRNNGNLSATSADLMERYGMSQSTVVKARRELVEAGLIVQTRQGHFGMGGTRCSLYALAWKPIDDCPGKDLDLRPTQRALLHLRHCESRA